MIKFARMATNRAMLMIIGPTCASVASRQQEKEQHKTSYQSDPDLCEESSLYDIGITHIRISVIQINVRVRKRKLFFLPKRQR